MNKLMIPGCWADLLALENISDSERAGSPELCDSHPYRDDVRELNCAFDDGTTVVYRLCSGDSNYWQETLVFRDGKELYCSEPSETIAPGILDLPADFKAYEVTIELR